MSKKERYCHTEVFVIISVTTLFFSFGIFRVNILESGRTFLLDSSLGTYSEHTGTVITDIERKENYNRFTVATRGEKILIYTNPLEKILYGDELILSGVLRKPEIFYDVDNLSNGKAFDWPQFLAKDEIYYELFYPTLVNTGKGDLSLFQNIKRGLFITKESFIKNVHKVVSEPEASLLAGEVLGQKSSLGNELQESLRRTGIIHVVVLSGYNVTIIADSIMRSLSFLPNAVSLYLGIGGIILFTLMTGASATVVRASIMAVLVILARRYGRLYDITIALLFAGFLMVLHNPAIILYDPSFQLSFLATMGLLYVSPFVEKFFKFIPKKLGMREIFGATIGTQIFVLPLLVYLVGQISLVSLPVNILVLPAIPLTMLFGFMTGVFGFISYHLSFVFGLVSAVFLSYQLFVVNFFDGSYSALIGIHISLWEVIFVYFGLFMYFIFRKKDRAI